MLSVGAAAKRLGVSERRVRALIESGRLSADRVGRAWVIAPSALGSVEGVRPPGRPLAAARAWKELTGAARPPRASAAMLRSRYRRRSERIVVDGPDIAGALADSAVLIGGEEAAIHYDDVFDVDPSAPRVAYVAGTEVEAWRRRHWLIDAIQPGIVVHVVEDGLVAAARAEAGGRFVPARVSAVDLAERGGPRPIEAALRVWRR